MARGEDENISNRNQGCFASSVHNSLTTERPEYPNTPAIKNGLKSHLMMMTEDFKKDIISLKKYRTTQINRLERGNTKIPLKNYWKAQPKG